MGRGNFNKIVPADAEALRRIAHILRFFGRLGFTASAGWEPHTRDVLQSEGGVFASRWPLRNETLYTMVNRTSHPMQSFSGCYTTYGYGTKSINKCTCVLHLVSVDTVAAVVVVASGMYQGAARSINGPQLTLTAANAATRFYDCYHGHELTPTHVGSSGGARHEARSVELSFPIEALGYGCVFVTPNQTTAGAISSQDLRSFLSEMAAMTVGKPLASFSKAWHFLPQEIDRVERVINNTSDAAPVGMVRIPGTARYYWQSVGMEIEGGPSTKRHVHDEAAQIVDVQYFWEAMPMKQHARNVSMPSFFIDRDPVTCGDYDRYLQSSGYTPANDHMWLKNWPRSQNGKPKLPPALATTPVTYLSFAEATAYCRATGKRLPSTIEWQYAAQGTTQRLYPWGDKDDTECRPDLQSNRTIPGTHDAHVL